MTLKQIKLIGFFGITFLTKLYSQVEPCYNYTIKEIDTVSLHYYNIIKASKGGSNNMIINILSDKTFSRNDIYCKLISVGDTYDLILKPIYSILDKRRDIDSVWLSPATMRSVEINKETFISSDYKIIPYKANNINGLCITEIECTKSE